MIDGKINNVILQHFASWYMYEIVINWSNFLYKEAVNTDIN